jgi:hypothetical protein
MNPNKASNETDNSFDHLLQTHLVAPTQLTPSSGFTLSVMDAIHQKVAEPAPLAFPWRRVLPGVIAILCGLAAFAVFVVEHGTVFAAGPQLLASATLSNGEIVLCSVFLTVCVSLATVAASFRLAGRNR